MAYVGSIVVVLLALATLGLLAWSAATGVRRFTGVGSTVGADLDRRVRMIVARLAALRVRWNERGT